MSFIQGNDIPVMLGCVSFAGTYVNTHLLILNYLHDNHLVDPSLKPEPKVNDYVDLKTLTKSYVLCLM